MPDPLPAQNKQLIAVIMLISAVTLGLVAVLMYAGVVPLPEESRGLVSMVVGGAAAADLLVCLWFFRKGQSS
jgi:hypothetical protein